MIEYLTENWRDVVSLLGLGLTLLGAVFTALPMWISPEEAGKIAVPRSAHSDPARWREAPAAVSLLRNSRGAVRGLCFIAVGSFLQAVPLALKLIWAFPFRA